MTDQQRELPPAEVLAAAVDQLAGEVGNLRASLAVTAAERDQALAHLAELAEDRAVPGG